MGGGAMRTAAKAAAFGGYRSVGPFADQASAATRRARSPAASVYAPAPAGESGRSISMISFDKAEAPQASAVPWPSWEIDDWEFAGGKEEELVDSSIHPAPRLVFGPVPTMEEAKEATSDLKEALEKVYFSSSTSDGSVKVSQVASPGVSAAILPTMPQHVVQAFSLLQGSPEAQNVVASLASDENVWAAVMKNEKVMEFYKNNQSTNVVPAESVGENENPKESLESMESPTKETSEGLRFFTNTVQKIKLKVSEMVCNIFDLLQEFMGPPTDSRSNPSTMTGTSPAENYVNIGIGASFIALAIAAILVVLLKRG